MKFSKETIAVLKNFASINAGIVLDKGSFVMTRSISNAVYADAVIPDDIETPIAIYDLPNFLKILHLLGEDSGVDINVDEEAGNIVIKSTKNEIYFPLAERSTVVAPKKKINFPVANVVFELKANELQNINELGRALSADTYTFTREGDKIVMNGYNLKADSSMERKLVTQEIADYDGEDEFNFVISAQSLKLIDDDYKVMLWGEGNKYAIRFEGNLVNYVCSLEAITSHTFG